MLKGTIDYKAIQSIKSSIDLLEKIKFFYMEIALTIKWLSWGKWYNYKEKYKWNISPFCKLKMHKILLEPTI